MNLKKKYKHSKIVLRPAINERLVSNVVRMFILKSPQAWLWKPNEPICPSSRKADTDKHSSLMEIQQRLGLCTAQKYTSGEVNILETERKKEEKKITRHSIATQTISMKVRIESNILTWQVPDIFSRRIPLPAHKQTFFKNKNKNNETEGVAKSKEHKKKKTKNEEANREEIRRKFLSVYSSLWIPGCPRYITMDRMCTNKGICLASWL